MIEQWTSASGVPVFFVPRREVPIVDINIDFAAGSVFDPPGKSGLADLLASVLLTGQKAYRAVGPYGDETLPAMREEAAEHAFDRIGAKVAADAQADRLSVGLRALSHPVLLRHAIALTSAMLAVPSWAARPIAREQDRLLAFAEEQLIDPEQLANLRLTQALYGDHPYGRLPDVESLENITTADLRAFHRQYLTRDRAVLTIVGDLSADDAKALAEQLALALPATAPGADVSTVRSKATVIDAPSVIRGAALDAALADLRIDAGPSAKAGEQWIAHPASQAHLLIGALTPGIGHPDYFPLMLANRMFSWMLNDTVRERLGLAYEVSSTLYASRVGEHRIVVKTRADQARRCDQAIRDTLRAFVGDALSDQAMLQDLYLRTRTEMVEGRDLALDSNAKLLRQAADIGFEGLPLNRIQTWVDSVLEVRYAQARETFARWIDPARQVRVVVGASEIAEEGVSRASEAE
ncbi:pitrilysin family protein [Robbsia sp. KACC 23696]|uniref:M16 family metallopeptidase n=1 Tax=Robbsia sp. KACC 23696 TaxID=3149231 RepID=UPI00325C0B7C